MMNQFNKKSLLGKFGIDQDDPGDQGLGLEPSPSMPAPEWPAGVQASPYATFTPKPPPSAGMPPASGVPSPDAAAVPAPIDYTKPGKYTSTAYDAKKMMLPWEQMSEKYKIGTVLSNFDPSKGLTPDVIDALNNANIFGAKFSGAGDKLTVDNVAGYDRFGKGGTSDVNIGFKTGNGTWGAWTDPNLPGNQVPVGGGAATAAGGLLSGNPLDVIRAEIAKLMGGNAKPNLQALLAQFGLG